MNGYEILHTRRRENPFPANIVGETEANFSAIRAQHEQS